jgi:hypothetical protein
MVTDKQVKEIKIMPDYYMMMCDIESEEKSIQGEIAYQEYIESLESKKNDESDDWLFYPGKDPDAWLKRKPQYDEF